jgi:hypothetical protein
MRFLASLLGQFAFCVSIGAILLMLFLTYRLNTKHNAYWRQQAAPYIMSWLWRRGYADLNDIVTVRTAVVLRAAVLVIFASSVTSLGLTLIANKGL